MPSEPKGNPMNTNREKIFDILHDKAEHKHSVRAQDYVRVGIAVDALLSAGLIREDAPVVGEGEGDLLPCPFCGSDKVSADFGVVECIRCGASIGGEDTAEAFAAWNIRTQPPHPLPSSLTEAQLAFETQTELSYGHENPPPTLAHDIAKRIIAKFGTLVDSAAMMDEVREGHNKAVSELGHDLITVKKDLEVAVGLLKRSLRYTEYKSDRDLEFRTKEFITLHSTTEADGAQPRRRQISGLTPKIEPPSSLTEDEKESIEVVDSLARALFHDEIAVGCWLEVKELAQRSTVWNAAKEYEVCKAFVERLRRRTCDADERENPNTVGGMMFFDCEDENDCRIEIEAELASMKPSLSQDALPKEIK